MVLRFRHTGKQGDDELLGYKRVSFNGADGVDIRMDEKKKNLLLTVECNVVSSISGEASFTHLDLADIVQDIANGYIEPL